MFLIKGLGWKVVWMTYDFVWSKKIMVQSVVTFPLHHTSSTLLCLPLVSSTFLEVDFHYKIVPMTVRPPRDLALWPISCLQCFLSPFSTCSAFLVLQQGTFLSSWFPQGASTSDERPPSYSVGGKRFEVSPVVPALSHLYPHISHPIAPVVTSSLPLWIPL